MLEEMQRAWADDERRVWEVIRRADVVPVDVAQDDIVDIPRGIEPSGAEALRYVRAGDDGLALRDVRLHGGRVPREVAFETEVEDDSCRWLAGILGRVLNQEGE